MRGGEVACVVDMGSYEAESHVCPGDANGDGTVNVNDLLVVINGWGTCPSSPALCPGDLAPYGCGNNTVNVNDLLVVIDDWGCNALSNENPGATGGMPTSVQDCMEDCSLEYEAYTAEWQDCVNKCVQGLCEAQIIDCD